MSRRDRRRYIEPRRRKNGIRNLVIMCVACGLLLAVVIALGNESVDSFAQTQDSPSVGRAQGRGRGRITIPADWPALRAVWSERNVFPQDDEPHPELVEYLRVATNWRGIATHWILVNHQERVRTAEQRKWFWGYAQKELDRLGIQLVPGLKVHDEFHPLTRETIERELATGEWATRLVDYAEGLHREYGFPIIVLDWEGFGGRVGKVTVRGEDFTIVRPAFQRAAGADWRFWHWFPGLGTARYEYRERTKHDATWRAARVRWNFAYAVSNSPRDRWMTGTHYWSTPPWSRAAESRFDPSAERKRGHYSLGIHNIIEGFTCASVHTLHSQDAARRYLFPEEVVEMPAWRDSKEVFLFTAPDQLAATGLRWRRLLRLKR